MKKAILKKGIKKLLIQWTVESIDLLLESEADLTAFDTPNDILDCIITVCRTKSFAADMYDAVLERLPEGEMKEELCVVSKKEFIEEMQITMTDLADKIVQNKKV